jgi:glutaredoxin-like YruB-family protein
MELVHIDSYNSLQNELKGTKKAYCLLYKKGSEQSDCALKNLEEAVKGLDDLKVCVANVAEVRDIHPKYQITSAPTLIAFENGEYKNVVKGCNTAEYYKNLFEESLFSAAVAEGEEKPQKRVTVYSTPTCSWCNTLKTHLRKHRIRFTDIDVSKDQAAAEAMVKRSGQQGVPQTDINGEIIIGFDKNRINSLLGIQG